MYYMLNLLQQQIRTDTLGRHMTAIYKIDLCTKHTHVMTYILHNILITMHVQCIRTQ